MSSKYKDLIGMPALKSNDTLMSIDAIISTATVDRDNDIMVPAGCDLSAFTIGPAPIFFGHQQFPFPVGSAKKSPDAPPSVFIEEDHVWSTCYFNKSSKEAEIVYELVKLGHLGSTSIGFIGHESTDLTDAESVELGATNRIRKYLRWELTEWSWVGIGANREAMAMHLSRGQVGGKKLSEQMTKAFSSLSLPRKYIPVQFPTIEKKSIKANSKGEQMNEMETEPNENDETVENGEGKMPGQELLEAMLGGMAGLCKSTAEALKMVEMPEVRKLAMRACKMMSEEIEKLAEAGKGIYEKMEIPEYEKMDFSEIDVDDPEEDEDEEDDEEMKSLEAEFSKAKTRLESALKIYA